MTKEEVIKLIEPYGLKCEFKGDTCNVVGSGNIPSDALGKIRQHYNVVLNERYTFTKLN
jgi:hypothetical protein